MFDRVFLFRDLEGFELLFDPSRQLPAWAERKIRPILGGSIARSLRHTPAELVPTPGIIPKRILKPPAIKPLMPRLLPSAATIGTLPTVKIKMGISPLIEEWVKEDRYNLKLDFHDPISTIGFYGAMNHELQHVQDIASIGGLALLLKYEILIAKYKPIDWDSGVDRNQKA